MTTTHPSDSSSTLRAPSRAILVALPYDKSDQGDHGTRQDEVLASPMMSFVDRPIVQHVIERLQDAGVRDLTVLGSRSDQQLRNFVDDNDRWGLRVEWIDGDRDRPFEPLRNIPADERIVLASTDMLPMHSLCDPKLTLGVAVMLGGGEANNLNWTVADGVVLETMPPECDRESFAQWIHDVHETTVLPACTYQTRTIHQLLASQRRLMESAPKHPLIDIQSPSAFGANTDGSIRLIGRESSPGIRICRNVKIHRTAHVNGPVFSGDNCRIGKGVRLEPNTVIGPNCVIDHHAVVANSTIEGHTYVGPWVEIQDCHLDRQHVANARLRARVCIDDPLVLDSV